MLASMRLLLLVVLVPAVAGAQPDRDMASACSGRPTGDEALVACGNHFLEAYNRAPAAGGADEHLYNAGVMFAEGHAIGAATQSFALLRKSFPRSKLAPRALAHTARLYAQVMLLEKAAEALEQYASTYANEKDAYAAASDAIYYRRALGDDDKVIQQTSYFVRTFGSKRPDLAAEATFALTSVYEKRGDHEGTRKHLQDYIRRFGAKAGGDKLVIAYAKLGQLHWQRSCPIKPVGGECVRRNRQRAPVCDGGRASVVGVKRDGRAVKDALAAFASAIRTYETASMDGAVSRYYYGRALLAQIDAEAEASLLPSARDQTTARSKLTAKYERLLDTKDLATAIAATSRIARLSDDVASAIVATAKTQADCKALAEAAAPFRETAIRGYADCLAKASEVGFFDDTARSCDAALTRLAPDQFPPLRELVVAGPNASLVVVSGP